MEQSEQDLTVRGWRGGNEAETGELGWEGEETEKWGRRGCGEAGFEGAGGRKAGRLHGEEAHGAEGKGAI